MKYLVDAVVTATPSKCSTTIIFKTAIERLLEERPNSFFYWLIPEWLTDDEKLFYPQDKRIKYIPIKQSKDRVREYLAIPAVLHEALTFYGPCWDFDILLTMRTGLVPQMRLLMNSPRTHQKWWTKEVWLIDVMPMLKFKQTVPYMVPDVQDRWVLNGYQAADRLWCVSYYEPRGIQQAARLHLPPSQAKPLIEKLKTGITAQFDTFSLKKPENMYKPGKAFGLSYIGRMEKANGIVDIKEILEKAWILRGDNVQQIACTVSAVVQAFDQELVDVRFPPREEFWKMCEEEIDAFVYISKEGAISLSVLEPLMLGVPCITMRDEMRIQMLGPDYPLYADGPASVYGVFKALYDDYAGMYEKFAKWHVEWFQPTWKKRFQEDLIYPAIVKAAEQFEEKLQSKLDKMESLKDNLTVKLIAEGRLDGETIYETIRRIGKKDFGVLVDKTDAVNHANRNLTFMSSFPMYRLGLKLFYDLDDVSVELGHLN